MPKSSFGQHTGGWGRLAASVEAALAEFPHLQPDLERLKRALERAWAAKRRQAELRAAAQQATRDLEAAMEEASEASVCLHRGLVSKLGTKSERLIEFGMRPHRSARSGKASGAAARSSAAPAPSGAAVPVEGAASAPTPPSPPPAGMDVDPDGETLAPSGKDIDPHRA